MKKVPSFDRPWRAAATWRIEVGPTLLRLSSSAVNEIVSWGHDSAKAVFGGGGRKGRVGGSFLFIGTLVSLARSINHRLSFVRMENGEKSFPFSASKAERRWEEIGRRTFVGKGKEEGNCGFLKCCVYCVLPREETDAGAILLSSELGGGGGIS